MEIKKISSLVGCVLVLLVLVGCAGTQASNENLRKSADSITEGILQGMNENNYLKFSENFDQQMKNGLPEAKFKETNPIIKEKIGNYISKQFDRIEKKDQYQMVIYKGRFSNEPDDVIIRTVLSESDGKVFVSGFWLDSPNLRQ